MEPHAVNPTHHWRARLRLLVLLLALLASVALPAGAGATPAVRQDDAGLTDYGLAIAIGTGASARLSEVGLLRGNARVFVSPDRGVERVRYYIDPAPDAFESAAPTGEPLATAAEPPFVLAGPAGFDTQALADGAHTLVAAIDLADGRSVVKTAQVQVHNGAPALLFDPVPLQVTVVQGGSVERAIRLMSSTGRSTRYSLASNADWLKPESPSPIGNPRTGAAPGSHILQFDAGSLAPGRYEATLTATAEGFAPATKEVVLEVLAPAADCAPLDCSQVKVVAPYTLTFDQDHGMLVDANGVGTGFTWVDKPSAGGTGYIPANLLVDTAAGLFKITTTGGIAYQGNNNQDNTLGVGIDAADQISVLDATLVNFPAQTANFEQAGLWYGSDDDNYLKLVVVYEPGGARVQFVEERTGVALQQVVSGVINLTGASVQLRMRADPVAKTVTGYYSLNGADFSQLSAFTVPPELFNADGAGIDPALGTRVFGGVFATDRFLGGTALFQFDAFSLTAESTGSGSTTFAWDRKSFAFSYPSSMVFGRDGRLYATETFGNIRAVTLDANLDVVSNQVIHTLSNRLVLGITEDPASTPTNVILWVAHSDGTIDQNGQFQGAVNSGIVSRFAGPGFAREDIITGLPRALANHSTNSLHFGPDGKLYIAQGGNTGAGAPNTEATEFGTRAEQPLSAALLVADVKATGFDGSCATPEESFGPSPCDVVTYATGMRNTYDFTFHSNGSIYGPDNGLGVDGTYPPQPQPTCTGLANPLTHDPGNQPDLLHRLTQGKYYGHPNPYRDECVFKNGSWQNVAPLANYVAPLLDLGMNKSANGIVEYRSNAFGGQLQGDLLITNYSVGDDITRVQLSADGSAVDAATSLIGGFTDPLPLLEGPDGRLYVGEHASSGAGGKITILTPKPVGSWTTKASMPPSLLDAGSAVVNGKLYVAGGKDGVGPKTGLQIYDPVANTWSAGAAMPASYPAVENPAGVAYNGKFYLFGGSTQPFTGAVTNAAVYDPGANAWTDLAPMTMARGGATAQVLNGKIYVIGGMGGDGASLASVEIYDPVANTWAAGIAMSKARDNPGSAVLGGKLYAFGGRTRFASGGEEAATPTSVEMFDPATNAWAPRASMPTGRRTPIVGLLEGKAQVVGGENAGAAFAVNEEYDPVANTWRLLSPMPTARHGAAGGTIGTTLYVAGGSTASGIVATNVNEAFSFDSTCAVIGVSISIAGGKVQLSWTPAAGVSGYEVHRSTGPYFTPATPYASNASSPWTDQDTNVGNASANYTYLVRAPGCTEPSSQRVAEFDFELTRGQ